MMTVEDPIEYALDGIAQTQVNPRIELDFARALRAILRQDPDVIMIGEIRDLETAQIAVQASLTGHLVLATLHTNDAASAVTRLADMGVEPYLLASSLLGVLAQRLVRTLCPACRVAAPPTAGEAQLLAELGLPPDTPLCAPRRAARTATARAIAAAPASTSCCRSTRRCAGMIHDGAASTRCATRPRAPACARCARDGARWIADGTHVARRTDARHARRVTRRRATMRAFRWEAVDAQGRCGAASLDAAKRRARRATGCAPTGSRRRPSIAARRAATALRAASRLPAPLVALATRQLATLAQSGMPLDQALAAVAEQADDAARREDRRRRCARRSRPANRCRRRWRAFRERSRRSIAAWSAAGAETGRLPEVLARLADYLEARAGAAAEVRRSRSSIRCSSR